jgi:ComF family protein
VCALRIALDALLVLAFSPQCACCGEPLRQPSRGAVCDACWRSIPAAVPFWRSEYLDAAQAAGVYDDALRAIVQALKYDARRSLAVRLGSMMRERCAEVLRGADLAVPVPLHRARRRERGFNQAADLAAHLGIRAETALRRTRPTRTQTGLGSEERRENVRGAFELARRATAIGGGVIVLVDDVCTTGATLEACARVLRTHGAREVRAVTAARAVR